MVRVGEEVRGGGRGCLVQSVRAEYSTILASATYLHFWTRSRVVQHARDVLNCTPGACNFTCFGRVTPCHA